MFIVFKKKLCEVDFVLNAKLCYYVIQNSVPLGSLPVVLQEAAILEDLLFCCEVTALTF